MLIGAVAASLFALSLPVFAEESHPGIGIESSYSEAVIAYNRKETDKALQLLDELLKTSPTHIESLELKALVLKGKGDDKQSIEVYEKLIKLKPEKERGAYYFETAVLLNKQKDFKRAEAHFKRAIKLDFNPLASHLFLGMIAFNDSRYSDAAPHFEKVTSGGVPDLNVVGHYYLGMLNFKQGFGAGGVAELTKAREVATTMPDNKTAADIKDAADKVLGPFKEGQWYANFSSFGQYDSNIQQVPNDTPASSQPSGKSTSKINFLGGFGYLSAPISRLQWIPGYRFSYNKNFNQDSKTYEYFTNTPSLALNYHPLELLSAGLRIEGNLTFQNQPDDPTDTHGAYTFHKYSTSYLLGPYVKYQFNRNLQVLLEFDYKPQVNYATPGLTGPDYNPHMTIKGDLGSRWLQPGLNVSYEIYKAQDPNFASKALDLGVYNSMKITHSDTVTLAFDYTHTPYSDASPVRTDNNYNYHLTEIHSLSGHFSILADVQYISNTSTLPSTYTYNRFMAGGGLSWNL